MTLILVTGFYFYVVKGKYFMVISFVGILWGILSRMHLDLRNFFKYKFAIPCVSTVLCALWPLSFITSIICDKKLLILPLKFYIEMITYKNNKTFVYYTKYEILCPICNLHSAYAKLKIKFDKKFRRFISVCEQNPSEHRFTFDYITLKGERIELS